MSLLPQFWATAELGEIIELKYGKSLPKQVRSGKGFAVFGSNGIIGENSEPVTAGPTIVIGRKGSIGEVSLSDVPCWPIDTTYYVDNVPGSNFRYWYYFLRQLDLKSLNKATAIPGLNRDDAYKLEIAIAPFNEQKRIADKLDQTLAIVERAKARLARVPEILKQFRQSVLAAATDGRLTEDWREEYAQPLNWREVRLSDIAEIQGGITKDSKKQLAQDEEVPYLRVANVQRGFLDLSEIKKIRIPANKLESLLLEPGDILFNEGGDIDKLERGWIWEGVIPRCSFQNHVFRARLFNQSNQPKYISWWGNSRGFDYFLRQGKQTTNLASINKTMLSNLPISLPSSEEQSEIVRRVETLFALADRIEARYRAISERVEKLTQALLAKAFRGELVPQDPNDEPASVLLDHIRAQRAAEPAPKRGRRGIEDASV